MFRLFPVGILSDANVIISCILDTINYSWYLLYTYHLNHLWSAHKIKEKATAFWGNLSCEIDKPYLYYFIKYSVNVY